MPPVQFIDTHTHIFASEFDDDRAQVIEKAKSIGVTAMVLPNIDSTSIDALTTVTKEFSGFCFPAMGLHPTSVEKNFQNELLLVEEQLSSRKYWGIGEIGIDLYWDKTFFEQQVEAFRHQLKLAKKFGLPVIIHSRNSFDEVLDVVDKEVDENLSGVFHSYSGSLDHFNRIDSYGGFLIGIGGIVTYKNGGVDKVLKDIPISKIVLETDSPYLSPVPNRGKRNDSSNLLYIAQRVAEIKGTTIEEVARITTANATKLFSL